MTATLDPESPPAKSAARLPLWVIVLAAAAVAGIGMGIRQVMGLYMKPVTSELGLGREAFGLAIALANIVWGLAAPFTGAVSDKFGTGRVVVMGALATSLGIYLLYAATTDTTLLLSGIFLGLGVAGAGINATIGAVARAATPETRTSAIAAIGMGSGIGILIALPYTHLLIEELGWKPSLLVLSASALAILPMAWVLRGKPGVNHTDAPQSLGAALGEAFRHPSFWLLNAGFFVCGFHLVFYGVHLPAYVADQGMSNEVAVWALMLVGLGNLVGTWLAGQWGQTRSKRLGLSFIYAARAVVFLGFLYLPITPLTVLVLSGVLGLLWLSTVPLTSGMVATFFGPRWMTMLYGIVFLSHQMGSFFGGWLGGYFFDRLKSYDAMWWISVALGIFAALVHLPIRERPVERPLAGVTPA
ncbi:MAG: MFS transporter [Hyphomicrobium sp.]